MPLLGRHPREMLLMYIKTVAQVIRNILQMSVNGEMAK